MSDMKTANDFFEDDEPVEKIKAAFGSGTKHLTQRPQLAYNERVHVPFGDTALVAYWRGNTTVGVPVSH